MCVGIHLKGTKKKKKEKKCIEIYIENRWRNKADGERHYQESGAIYTSNNNNKMSFFWNCIISYITLKVIVPRSFVLLKMAV